jgi:hypothetical protein
MTAAPVARRGDATAVVAEQLAELGYREVPRATVRAQVLALVRRPSRVAQLERLVARYRWANAGLRERLREAEVRHDQTLDELTALVDEQASIIGHAHPAVTGARAIIGEARVR